MNAAVVLGLCLVAAAAAVAAVDPALDSRQGATEEGKAKEYLRRANEESAKMATESVVIEWAYASNITEYNLAKKLEFSAKHALFVKNQWKETIKYPWKTYKDEDIRRQFKKFSVLGVSALTEAKHADFEKIVSSMQSIYSKATICDFKNNKKCDLHLEPEISAVMSTSRNPAELRHAWIEWRKATGEKSRAMYQHYVALSNEAAVLNNFTDNAEYWLDGYECPDFPEQVDALWQELKPLYLNLHAYVRRRLRETYGKEVVSEKGPIPAHLLGNMWGQTWSNIFDISTPYPGKASIDVSDEMKKQGYTPTKMFKLSEEFFVSLGLSKMPDVFWEKSILEKPADGRDLVCHASAWDFYDSKDFRIKQCTTVSMEELFVAHHEMGHIQYFLQYKDQPRIYLEGANPGFHEAVGDVMALSVSTPKHLKKIGLLDKTTVEDPEATINFLYLQGLAKIAFLPYGYMLDRWRWNVFQGKTAPENYNCDYWKLRHEYQGIEAPVDRSEQDFDAGAKYHVIADVPYIRYFVSFVIQFQFHRALCIEAGQYDPNDPKSAPLHECDIYESKEAGALLGKMLQLGSSKPWPDAMEVLTGQRKMDASGVLEYFKPLQAWLEADNTKNEEFIGWGDSRMNCVKDPVQVDAHATSNAS